MGRETKSRGANILLLDPDILNRKRYEVPEKRQGTHPGTVPLALTDISPDPDA